MRAGFLLKAKWWCYYDRMPAKKTNGMISISTGTIVRTILVLILFYFLYYIRDVVLVILSAIVVASAVEPGTKWFSQRKIPRIVGVLIIYVAAIALLISSFYFFLLPLAQDSSDFLKTLPEYSAAASQGVALKSSTSPGFLEGFSKSFSLPAIINSLNATLINLSSGFFGTIDVVFGGIISFFLIVTLSFYLAVQEDGVGKFLRIVTPLSHERYVIDLWERSKLKIGLWMQGQLLLAIIVAVLVYLGLTLVGVPNPLVLGFLAGVFELIPIFGAFLAAAPAIMVSFLDGGLTIALVVAGLYIIIQQFESQLIYPLVVKKVVGVPPMISILALVIGGKLAGFLGLILAVPLAAVLMELLNDLEKSKGREAL